MGLRRAPHREERPHKETFPSVGWIWQVGGALDRAELKIQEWFSAREYHDA